MTAHRGVSLQPYGGHTSTAALRAMLRQIKNHFAKHHAAIGALRRAHLGREIVIGKKTQMRPNSPTSLKYTAVIKDMRSN